MFLNIVRVSKRCENICASTSCLIFKEQFFQDHSWTAASDFFSNFNQFVSGWRLEPKEMSAILHDPTIQLKWYKPNWKWTDILQLILVLITVSYCLISLPILLLVTSLVILMAWMEYLAEVMELSNVILHQTNFALNLWKNNSSSWETVNNLDWNKVKCFSVHSIPSILLQLLKISANKHEQQLWVHLCKEDYWYLDSCLSQHSFMLSSVLVSSH